MYFEKLESNSRVFQCLILKFKGFLRLQLEFADCSRVHVHSNFMQGCARTNGRNSYESEKLMQCSSILNRHFQ